MKLINKEDNFKSEIGKLIDKELVKYGTLEHISHIEVNYDEAKLWLKLNDFPNSDPKYTDLPNHTIIVPTVGREGFQAIYNMPVKYKEKSE